MSALDPVALARQLVDIPSVTGQEMACAELVTGLCHELGLKVILTEIENGRPNLLALAGPAPQVLLCTHLDTVPPHFPASEDETHVYGRGACDAKGIIAAMLVAAQRLLDAGVDRFGLLLTAGEETDSRGAKVANEELKLPSVRHVIVGEPTDNRLAVAQKGILSGRLVFHGHAAHGAYPEAGRSAIEGMVMTLADLYRAGLGASEELGDNVLNVGLIRGGTARNVLAPEASAELQVRVATSVADVQLRLGELIASRAELEILQTAEPLRLGRLDGYPTTVVGFGTDLPYLTRFGQRYLIGPGSILDAHTAHEKVRKTELYEAVDIYVQLVRTLAQAPEVTAEAPETAIEEPRGPQAAA